MSVNLDNPWVKTLRNSKRKKKKRSFLGHIQKSDLRLIYSGDVFDDEGIRVFRTDKRLRKFCVTDICPMHACQKT